MQNRRGDGEGEGGLGERGGGGWRGEELQKKMFPYTVIAFFHTSKY